MADRIEFETPENVVISYELAGLGSRFIAFFIDSILLFAALVVILIFCIVLGSGGDELVDNLERYLVKSRPQGVEQPTLYVMGVFVLIWGLSGFLYYGLSEYFLGGQTIGKRNVGIRVVKTNGFSLDAGSIFTRNIFRVLDHIPLTWIVPFLSEFSQRFGDIVAGTVVIKEEKVEFDGLRERLLEMPANERMFRFDPTALRRVGSRETEAAEKIVKRWVELKPEERETLAECICRPLARNLRVPAPEAEHRLRFLQDFLAAQYHQQYKRLG